MYGVLIAQGCENLIDSLSGVRESMKKFVHAEKLFNIFHYINLPIVHSGRDRNDQIIKYALQKH